VDICRAFGTPGWRREDACEPAIDGWRTATKVEIERK